MSTPSTEAEWKTLFIATFPEFEGVADAMLLPRLEWAQQRTPSNIWGNLYVQGVLLLWAHMLAMSPQGENMRLEGGTDTIYNQERKMLQRTVASGFRVCGIN